MSFLAPLFLFGLLAALIPWWLHRLSASNPPKTNFGSTRLLDANQSPSSKKKRTRYWLLLALRFLFAGLLSLIFAEPVIERLKIAGGVDSRHIIVIDTSMSQKLDGRWQRSLDIANQILNNATDGDEAVVISAADQFVQSPQSSNSIDAAQTQLSALAPGNTRLDYGRIGSAVAAVVSEGDNNVNNHLHVITDIQASAMPARFTSLAVDKIQKINVYSTAAEADSNAFVTGKLEHTGADNAAIVAVINNHADAQTHTLSVTSNGNTLASAQVDVGQNQIAVHRFPEINLSTAAIAVTIILSLYRRRN